MIKSIVFDGEKGYIGEKYTNVDKPEKPRKDDYRYSKYTEDHRRVLDEEKYNSDMERYKSEMSFYKKHKGEYKVQCSELLVGRKFEFSSDRINLIFGPNASGKSTILKSIASHAFCTDGWSSFQKPLDFRLGFDEDKSIESYKKNIAEIILQMSGTSSQVDWDGSPIYYHNFENRENYGQIGDLSGSIIESIGEEMTWRISKNKSSNGQKMFYQFSKLMKFMSKTITYNEILEHSRKYLHSNEYWRNCFLAQEEYFKSFPMAFDPNGQNTYLFDEIDKSTDILNVNELYTKIFPFIIDKYGCQIIVISHSPLVLRDEIYNSDKYNFISMDEKYTNECRKLF